jgi:hypothetical protein
MLPLLLPWLIAHQTISFDYPIEGQPLTEADLLVSVKPMIVDR